MPAIVNSNEIALVGAVGDPSGWGWDDCFTAADVIMALAQVGATTDILVRLNSGGGIATEGSAIHSAIARHKGKKTILVEGIAASAASIIAMAGDDVVMALGAMLMIHDPSGLTIGTAADHEAQVAALTALGDAMATIYAAKSERPVEDCRADMRAEVWLTADQAVERGYADRVEGAAIETPQVDPAPFNYAAYAHAPSRLVAMAQANHWTTPFRMAAPTRPRAEQENRMPNITDEDLNARLDAARAEGRTEGRTEAETQAASATATMTARSQASEIARLCAAEGVPTMAAALLAEGATVEQARARVAQAGEIRSMVALARNANPAIAETFADELIAGGNTVDQARAKLFDKVVAVENASELRSAHRAGAGGFDKAGGSDKATAKAAMKASMQKQLGQNKGA